MDNSSYVTLSRQTALSRQMEVIANNMANVSTPAFKGESVLFAEVLQRTSTGETLSFAQDRGSSRNTAAGPLTATGNTLDFAIQGDGYFVVETEDGERYTRSGRFQLDSQGRLVTHEGNAILGATGQPIVTRPGDGPIEVTRDGVISAARGIIGRIEVVSFENEQSLRKTAGGLYATDERSTPSEDAEIIQGMIEQSNVEPVLEITRMITLMRSFTSAQKLLETEHERQLKAIGTIVSANA
jgi:flagellar basal-body rod protein FlgF